MNNTKLAVSNWRVFLTAAAISSLFLAGFYYSLLFAVTQDVYHPFNQFALYQPWMSLLVLGFGVQSGLYWLMRKGVRFSINRSEANVTAGTSTAVSGTAMIACCAHHAADLVPVLGVSGAALFLSEYQQQFLILGVITNFLGILFMLWHLWGKPSISFPLLSGS
jgi:hypothetical protein